MVALGPLVSLIAAAAPLVRGLPTDAAAFAARQSNPFNPFLSIITNLGPIKLLVDGAADGLTNLEALAAPLVGGTNQTDLTSNKPCAQMTVIFARGTTEPGNMGVVVGPQFVNAIKASMPAGTTMNVQGVQYEASIQGYLAGGGADGTASMTSLVTQTLQTCPQTKLVMSGYSQGGQVVHNTADALGAATMAKINSVVIFGDPKSKTPVTGAASKTLVICHDGDDICSNGDLILPAHLTYGLLNADQAGKFVAGMASGAASAKQVAEAQQSQETVNSVKAVEGGASRPGASATLWVVAGLTLAVVLA